MPFVFHHFFLAISRVQNRVRGAGIFSVFAGAAELLAAWYGGSHGSLTDLVAAVAIVMGIETALVVSAKGAELLNAVSGATIRRFPTEVDQPARSFVVRIPRSLLPVSGSWRVSLAAGLAAPDGYPVLV